MVIARFEGVDTKRQDMVVEVRVEGGEPATLVSSGGRVHLVRGPAVSPDVILSGPADAVAGLLGGRVGRHDAKARKVKIEGDAGLLAGLRPRTGLPAARRSR
jgi:hypothetical protein